MRAISGFVIIAVSLLAKTMQDQFAIMTQQIAAVSGNYMHDYTNYLPADAGANFGWALCIGIALIAWDVLRYFLKKRRNA